MRDILEITGVGSHHVVEFDMQKSIATRVLYGSSSSAYQECIAVVVSAVLCSLLFQCTVEKKGVKSLEYDSSASSRQQTSNAYCKSTQGPVLIGHVISEFSVLLITAVLTI